MSSMGKSDHRVNVIIREDQYQRIVDEGLNLSGLIRDLIDDSFSSNKIVLSMKRRTKKLYDYVVSNFAVSDEDLEPYILDALDRYLADKEKEINKMRKTVKTTTRP